MHLDVVVEHHGSPIMWSEHQGIEFWSIALVLSGTSRRAHENGQELAVAERGLGRLGLLPLLEYEVAAAQ